MYYLLLLPSITMEHVGSRTMYSYYYVLLYYKIFVSSLPTVYLMVSLIKIDLLDIKLLCNAFIYIVILILIIFY